MKRVLIVMAVFLVLSLLTETVSAQIFRRRGDNSININARRGASVSVAQGGGGFGAQAFAARGYGVNNGLALRQRAFVQKQRVFVQQAPVYQQKVLVQQVPVYQQRVFVQQVPVCVQSLNGCVQSFGGYGASASAFAY